MPKTIHKPVLLKESIEYLNLKPGLTVVDATLGGGGHSQEILKRILPAGKLIAIDWDKEAIDNFKNYLDQLKLNLKKENVFLVNANFARLKSILGSLKINKVGAIIADLGISSDQLKDSQRGLSFLVNGPLDMRINPESKITARLIVNKYSKPMLEKIFREYGEEKYAAGIAKEIIKKRRVKEIRTTQELVEIIARAVPEKYKHQRLHFATKTFQALRLEANNEIENLKKFLFEAVEVLDKQGRLAVIAFHSGEDRVVKKFFRENARGCVSTPEELIYGRRGNPVLKIITKKPIVPSFKEIKMNLRARSAKLRVAEKISNS